MWRGNEFWDNEVSDLYDPISGEIIQAAPRFRPPLDAAAGPPLPIESKPQSSSAVLRALSWLGRLIMDGFVAYGLAMCPTLADPGEFLDWPLPKQGTGSDIDREDSVAEEQRNPWR